METLSPEFKNLDSLVISEKKTRSLMNLHQFLGKL